MAKRRALLAGLGSGISDAAMLLFQNKLLTDRRAGERENMTLQAVLTNLLTRQGDMAKRVQSGEITPEQAQGEVSTLVANLPAFLRNRLDVSADYGPLAPSRAKRLAPIGESISGAQSPEAVPSAAGIRRRALERNVPLTQTRDFRVGDTGITVPNGVTAGFPDIEGLIAEAGLRRGDLEAGLPKEAVSAFDDQGNAITQFLTEREQAGRTLPRERTPEQNADFTRRGLQAEADAGIPTLKGTAEKTTKLTGELSPEVVSAEAAKAGRVAGAQESARLHTYFKPEFVKGRMDEIIAKNLKELELAGEKDKQQIVMEQGRAVAQLTPGLERVAALTDKLNQGEGLGSRALGMRQRGEALVGRNPAATQLTSELAKLTRPLAVTVLGVREANVSNTEQEMVAAGLGIKLGATRSERVAALRNLRAAIFVGPEATKRLPYNATPQDRIAMTKQLMNAMQQAEDAAIAAWNTQGRPADAKPVFLDPVTGSWLPIVQ